MHSQFQTLPINIVNAWDVCQRWFQAFCPVPRIEILSTEDSEITVGVSLFQQPHAVPTTNYVDPMRNDAT